MKMKISSGYIVSNVIDLFKYDYSTNIFLIMQRVASTSIKLLRSSLYACISPPPNLARVEKKQGCSNITNNFEIAPA